MTAHHTDDNSDESPDVEAAIRQAAQRRMRAARYWIATNCPYYMTALFRCPLRTTDHVDTVVIDRNWRIWANPAHINTLTVGQTAVELMHVLNHALRGHHHRAQHTIADPFLALAWNVAADCEINDDLLDGLAYRTAELPDHWLTPWKLHMGDSQTAETYYRRILGGDRIDPDTGAVAWLDQGSGDVHRHSADCGSAATGITPHWEPPADPHTPSDTQARMLRRRTAQHALDHEQQDPDTVPEALLRWAHEQLDPQIDWRRALAAALRRAAHHRTGDNDYTWTRPPRRPNPHTPHGEILRPATSRPIPDLAVIVDTSGSMDADDHNTAIAEIDAICARVTPGHHIDYYAVDTKTRARQRITNTRQLPLHGGGGTDMAAGINTAAQTRPTAIIVLTDGHTPWPDQPPPGQPTTVAVLIGDDAPTLDIPHWIQTIHIN
ncbi:DUF2201 family putative metallopeptidase [Candidatus Poriferisodalis sp.]|uniref:vWA domain-containing protein n=1 Tax=Candidatus Poriferisodalis sp. TaxID=3101277 RepID=UPI003B52B7F6